MVETTGSQAVMPSQISGAIDVPLLLLAAVVLNFCVHSVVCADEPPESLMRIQRAQYLMGTEMGIVVYATDEATADRACIDAFKRIRELEESLSDYDAESELSLLSKASPTKEPVRCSDDLWLMLETSYQLSERTEGAFDITVGPLSKLWRVAKRQKRLPRDQDLQAALPSVGYRHLKLHPEQHSVELTTAGMQLDLGSIAKGYASDEALKELAKHGFKRALVSAGGGLSLGDPPPGQSGWRIGVAGLDPEGPMLHVLSVANCGVATAGDAEQFIEIDGQRYSHIFDPRTGRPLAGRYSVTVVAPNGLMADALDTPVAVLGADRGLRLIEATEDASAIISIDRDGRTETQRSRGFDRWIAP